MSGTGIDVTDRPSVSAGAETDVAGWRTLAEEEIRAEFGIPSGTGISLPQAIRRC
jgi:hypothetical protein